MTTVLLTGASGFIGRQCLILLQAKGYQVHAISRQGRPGILSPGTHWHELDLLKFGSTETLMSELKPDLLLHLAWYAIPGKFWSAPENLEWVRASLEMLSAFACHGGKRAVVAGSCTEYDWSVGECIEGITPLAPATLYGMSKCALQSVVQEWSGIMNLSFAWGRIFHLYGPFEHPSRVVAYAVRSLLENHQANCSNGSQIHDFSHVEDVAGALVAVLESEIRGPVNIGSGIPVTVRDMLEEIGRQIGRPELLRLAERDEVSIPPKVWANTRRLHQEVGWLPRYNLKRGLEQTIAWWRQSLAEAALPRSARYSPY